MMKMLNAGVRIIIWSVVPVALLAAIGCSPFHALKFAEQDSDEGWSCLGSATEFGRGVSNVAGCWMEIPYSMERRIRHKAADRDNFSFIGITLDTAIGLTDGALRTGQRAVAGVVEIVLSPFPPHGPLVEPASPFHMYPVEPDDKEPAAEESIFKLEINL